jgi:hypothetical protein
VNTHIRRFGNKKNQEEEKVKINLRAYFTQRQKGSIKVDDPNTNNDENVYKVEGIYITIFRFFILC